MIGGFFASNFNIVSACTVSLTLCVLIKFAPFKVDITSHTSDGIKRSFASSLNNLPIYDFLETEIQIGFESFFISFSFEITSISRLYQGTSFISVKNGFLPSTRKNPIDGSMIILSSLIPALFAIVMLSFRSFIVPEILSKLAFGNDLFLLYAPTMTGRFDFDTISAISLSYFNPVISLIALAPNAIASLATLDLGVSIEIGKLQLFLTMFIACFILLISSSIEMIV